MAAAMVDMLELEPIEEDVEEWQTCCRMLQQRASHLLISGEWTDCTFLVGKDRVQVRFELWNPKNPPVSLQIRAHKLMLAAASPVFENMFYKEQTECDNDIVEVPDVQTDAFQALLNYIYTANISLNSYTMAHRVYKAAHVYAIPQLAGVCSMYMSCNLTLDNVLHALQEGYTYGEQMVIDECLQMIRQHTRDVLAQLEFRSIDLHCLVAILKQDRLRVGSELELWKVVVDFAKRHPATNVKMDSIERRSINNNTIIQTDGSFSSEEVTIRSAIKELRFLTLTAEQFASGPAGSDLLTKEEAFAVLMNIANVAVPMPEGFSSSREPRWLNSSSPRVPSVPRAPQPARSSLSFRLTVRDCHPDHLSILERPPQSVVSPPQLLMGATWRVKMIPRYITSTSNYNEWYLGVYISCEDPKEAPWKRRICLRCTVQPQKPEQTQLARHSRFVIDSESPEQGFKRYMSVMEYTSYRDETRASLEIDVLLKPEEGFEDQLEDGNEADNNNSSSEDE